MRAGPGSMEPPRMSRWELEEHDRTHPPLPGSRMHHCTDTIWVIIVGVAMFALLCVGSFYAAIGNLARLENGFNSQGQMCGVDVPDKPYVFWCTDYSGTSLDFAHPICTAACPTNSSTDHECFDPQLNSTVFVADYPTYLVGDFCMPSDVGLESLAWGDGGLDSAAILQFASDVRLGWLLLLLNAAMSAVMGFVFLGLLEKGASNALTACIFLCIALPVCFGLFFITKSHSSDHPNTEVTPEEFQGNLLWGLMLLVIAGLLGVFSYCACSDLAKSLKFIEASCECIFSEPTIMLEPIISLCIKLVVFSIMLRGFLAVLSTGIMDLKQAPDGGVAGKEIHYTEEECAAIAFWIFMTWWAAEALHCMSQYVIAWSTQLWYFTPYDERTQEKHDMPECCVCRAYVNVVKYHIGTVALGGLIVGLLRVPRTIFKFLEFAALSPNRGPIKWLCGCCIRCYNRYLHPFSKVAFMDVAITSSNFCTAARRAQRVVQEEGKTAAALNGGQLIVLLAGSGVLTMLGFAFTWIGCSRWSRYSNEASPTYIEEPRYLAVAGAFVSFLVSVSFVVVFDTVGDTILYCYATEQCRMGAMERDAHHGRDAEDTSWWPHMPCAGRHHGAEEAVRLAEKEQHSHAPPKLRRALLELDGHGSPSIF